MISNRQFREAVRHILIAMAAIAAIGSVAACSSGPPSAQCRRQFAAVKAYQADAGAISSSSQIVTGGLLSQFDNDVRQSGSILKKMKQEGCPDNGYKP